jgi:hypothetical protein
MLHQSQKPRGKSFGRTSFGFVGAIGAEKVSGTNGTVEGPASR